MPSIAISCRVCGLEFALGAGQTVGECPACGTMHGRPKSQGEGLEWLRRANTQRAACDFAHAEADYRSVLIRQPDEHEALWGLVMCKYGVEFITDPRTQERRPVLHFLRRRPIIEDADFRRACAWAPEAVADRYRADARYISQIQQQLLKPEEEDRPCDIFLCYKGSAADGKGNAREYEYARELYYHLKETGYRVFFAHETLRHVAGANYEARIYHALHSAKVMLVICSDVANLTTPWVRSEWSRFLERIDAGEKCRLIPLLYDGCDPYTLPDEFVNRSLQALRMDELTSLDVLRANLKSLVHPAAGVTPVQIPSAVKEDTAGKVLSIEYALANGNWSEAGNAAAELIREDPKCSMAYLCKLLAKLQLPAADQLRTRTEPFEGETDWQWALRTGTPAEKEQLTGILNDSLALRRRIAEEKQEQERQRRAEEEVWMTLGTAFDHNAGQERWVDARQLAESMIARRPQNPRGYLSRLMTDLKLSHPGQLGGCAQAFEEMPDWQQTVVLSSPEDRQGLDELLQQSLKLRQKISRDRRRAERQREEEEKRLAREAEEAAKQREAEKKRLAREAEEAEKRRLQEEQLREEEKQRRERDKEIVARVRKLLDTKRWEAAEEEAGLLCDCPEKPLYQLLARYHASNEQELLHCEKPFHLDELWDKALQALPRRREELKRIEETRKKRVEHSRTWKFGILFGLATVAVLYTLAFFFSHSSFYTEIALGVSVLAFDTAIWFNIMRGYRVSVAGVGLRLFLMLLAPVGAFVLAAALPDALGLRMIVSAALSLIALIVYLYSDWTLKLDRWCIRWQMVWLLLYLCVALGLMFWPSDTLVLLRLISSSILPAVIAVCQGVRFGKYHSRERRPRSA